MQKRTYTDGEEEFIDITINSTLLRIRVRTSTVYVYK